MMNLNCPHCGHALTTIQTDPLSDWGGAYLDICFNDSCIYFKKSWSVLGKQGAPMGYRYYFSEETSNEGPLLVANENSYKHCTVDLQSIQNNLEASEVSAVSSNDTCSLKDRLYNIERKLDQLLLLYKNLIKQN